MGVYTYVCRSSSGGEWTGKQTGEEEGGVEASAGTTYDLQRKLVQSSLSKDTSGGSVSSSFSLVSPSSAVFQVIIGGGGGGGFMGGGAAPAASSGGAAAAEAPAAVEKVEEKDESDDDLGFSLFD